MGLRPVLAQEYGYARYDVKDGLAGSVVYCATEDKDGFLWFGTETGLSRFDGTHFKNFTTADGLPDNEVLRLFTDSRGRVWISTFSNAICYYYEGKIHNQQNDSLLSRITISSTVLNVVEDRDGCVAVLETAALHIITPGQKIIVINRVNNTDFVASKVGLGPNGNFWMLIVTSVKGKYIQTVAHGNLTDMEKIPDNSPAGYNDVWFYPGLTITKKPDESLHFVQYPGKISSTYMTPAGYINVSLIDDSICAVSSSNGSLFYNIRKGLVIRHCLKGKIINAVFRDSEDNYWFVSQGSGIFRIGSFDFNNITFTENNLDYYSIFSILKIDSSVYVGSENSLLYKIDSRKEGLLIKKIHLSDNIGNNRTLSMISIPGKRTVLGTTFGLLDLDMAGRKVKRDSTYAFKSMSLYKDSLLVSTHLGAFLVAQSLVFRADVVSIVYHARATCAYGRNDTFYVGTVGGLYRTVGINAQPVFLGARYLPFKNRITDIKEAPDGILWIATSGNGLVGYQHDKVIYHIRQQDGLTSDICRTIYIGDKDVWVGTEKGLNRVQFKNGSYTVTTFTSTDGLIADIINAVYVQGNEVYVGTPAGLTYFDANKISLHSYCKLHITGIQTSHTKWTYDTSGFVLPHADNDVRIEYVGISYRSAGDITYRYRLKGLNDNWQTTRETFVSYPSLPSGDYELQLTAINKFGVESEVLRLPFSVEKLLWERNWFRILALIIVWGIIWIFVNARIKRVRQQNDQKMQVNNRMAELEQMALKAQMNPHFIFNSLNSLQHYVIEKDVIGANKFITDFSRLIRLTLDISSRSRIDIYEEISYITTYLELEKTKFEDKFSYEIVLAPDINPSDWHIPPMILQPYVENSIRHGVRNRKDKLGHIAVTVATDNEYLVCTVEDNGVGRMVAAQHKSQMPIEYQSKGMTLTARRIEMLNREHDTPVLIAIEDLYKDDKPAGTRVTLKFPLQDAGRTI
jgi:ligand-binding sensor domain-containing protein